MSNELIIEDVSIYSKPSLDSKYPVDKGAQITIGDLHGNAMKFIFTLVKHGIIINISDDDYQTLVKIYQKDSADLTSDDLKQFNEIINSLSFSTEAKLRLLGDELSDRGSNDYFTLKIIEKLHSSHVPLEIILSNHSTEFILAYETKRKFFATVMENRFTQSMINLQILIAKKLITRDDIINIINKSYKPLLKAISYTINNDLTSITLFSHAPIDIRAIRALAKRLAVDYEDFSAVALAKSIDNINACYQNYVDSNSVHTLVNKMVLEDGYNLKGFSSLYHPFEYIIWNRDLEHLDLPLTYKGYSVVFVHGHDNAELEKFNLITLDNYLGKSAELSSGKYTALYSHEVQLIPTVGWVSALFARNPTNDTQSKQENVELNTP